MGARVRAKGKEDLEVVDHGSLISLGLMTVEEDAPPGVGRRGHFLGTREGTGPASLSSLRQALLGWRRRVGSVPPSCLVNVSLAAAPEEDFSAYEYAFLHGGPSSSVLLLKGDRLLVWVPSRRTRTPRPGSPRSAGCSPPSCGDVG